MATEICCCESGIWVIIIAGSEIVLSAVGIILITLILAGVHIQFWILAPMSEDGSGSLVLLIIVGLVTFGMGFLLLFGALKNRICYLRTWFIVHIVFFVIFTISEIVEVKSKGPVTVVDGLITLATPCFVMWAVRVRIRDLETPPTADYPSDEPDEKPNKLVCTCGRNSNVTNEALEKFGFNDFQLKRAMKEKAASQPLYYATAAV